MIGALLSAIGFFLLMIVLVFMMFLFGMFAKCLITSLFDFYRHCKEREHNTDPDDR